MRILSVRQLSERLGDVFDVLTGGARSAPARHQALRATLDWSHDLLTTQERVVFRRLAVFTAGSSSQRQRPSRLRRDQAGPGARLISRLADKSLLLADREHERYQMLATIREYATERLAAAAERDQARRAHLAYYTEFAEQAGARLERAAATELEAALDRLTASAPTCARPPITPGRPPKPPPPCGSSDSSGVRLPARALQREYGSGWTWR